MPRKEDGTPPKSFTWITGNPRSKKNITQIRRHAGQNSGNKTDGSSRLQSSSSPNHGQQNSTLSIRGQASSQRGDTRSDSPGFAVNTQPFDFQVKYPSFRAEVVGDNNQPAPSGQQQDSPRRGSQRSDAASEQDVSTAEATSSARKVAIWDLVNHSAEEEEQHRLDVLATSPSAKTEDGRSDYFGGNALRSSPSKQRLRSTSPRRSDPRTASPATSSALQANISKRRKHVSASNSHITHSWRIGTSISSPMTLSKEDSQLEQILLQTDIFYNERFESSWSALLRERGTDYFDSQRVVETCGATLTTASALVAVHEYEAADAVLDRVIASVPDLLKSQHPQLYFMLAEISLENDRSYAHGRIRSEIKRIAAAAALKQFGASHPLTVLLRFQHDAVTPNSHRRLREQVQRRIAMWLSDIFTPMSYQATGHQYFFARTSARIGQPHEACSIMAKTIPIWESTYGPEATMTITGMLELARLQMTGGDIGQGTERLVSAAYRKLHILEDSVDDHQIRMAGLVHLRMGCLRAFGRLHMLRANLATAHIHFGAALSAGLKEMGSDTPAVKLALADLKNVEAIMAIEQQNKEDAKEALPEPSLDSDIAKLHSLVEQTQDGDLQARWTERHLGMRLKRLSLSDSSPSQ